MTLPYLQRLLQAELARRGRGELMDAAVGGIGLTDDGGTIYVHLFPKQGWPHKAQGRAYVLAWQDYAEAPAQQLDCYRWLMSEAKLSLGENVDGIIRWLEGR